MDEVNPKVSIFRDLNEKSLNAGSRDLNEKSLNGGSYAHIINEIPNLTNPATT